MKPKISLLAFFLIWAERQRWAVPAIHVRACHWLEHRGNLAVLRCFRGFGKSTILAVYNAWRYYCDPTYRILHQGDQDKTAYKTSRDTRAVLMRHPLTKDDFAKLRGEAAFWWVPGAEDERNPSMQAAGITSNITSSRCDEAQNDDVEVPRNIQNPEAREKMRYRLGEQTHCMVPGARQLFIGTPHTHDSLYDEQEAMGADCLTIKMFTHEHRIEHANGLRYAVPFEPEMIFVGIGKHTRELIRGTDYQYAAGVVALHAAPGGLLDFYAGSAWPERFTLAEMAARRQKCKTVNEWDSQYQLHSKPIGEIRLDPEKVIPYDLKPVLTTANREAVLMLGRVRIVGARCRWDCSLGKINSDASAISLILTDAAGKLYWQFAIGLTGDIDEQCARVRELVIEYHIPGVTVETNGVGGFVPAILRKHLKGLGDPRRVLPPLVCGVTEDQPKTNKNKDILDAFEAPMSIGLLWAHVDVLDGPMWDQMKDWNPAVTDQPDDYLDSGARAIKATPVRIGQGAGIHAGGKAEIWRPDSGVHEVLLES